MPESVPYQAYRSKRHSQPLQPTPAPAPPLFRPTTSPAPQELEISLIPSHDTPELEEQDISVAPVTQAHSPEVAPDPPRPSTAYSVASSSSSPKTDPPTPTGKKVSTFRRVARSNNRPSLPPSPLLTAGSTLVHSRNTSTTSLAKPPTPLLKTHDLADLLSDSQQRPRSPRVPVTSPVPNGQHEVTLRSSHTPSTSLNLTTNGKHQTTHSISSVVSAISLEPTTSTSSRNLSQSSDSPQAPLRPADSAPQLPRHQAPYRPGFQPRGFYRPITDDFITLRSSRRDGNGSLFAFSKVERMKLNRRLGKLIELHFLPPNNGVEKANVINVAGRPGTGPRANGRRFSSLRDIDFRRISISDAGGLLRTMVSDNDANSVRAAEQLITPWQDDATVSKCPLCSVSFHPLTCRKHHCRLCGQIICDLPIKVPQRLVPCSFLFVVDAKTRIIEEVKEGVDYGVRRNGGKADKMSEEDKFLKGVRICHSCRPIIMRKQYEQEAHHTPLIVRIHKVLVDLEREIEELLHEADGAFQQNSDWDRSKERISVKKRLLDSLAQYETLTRQLQKLPNPSGPGGSHDRVQKAIITRASLFLQRGTIAFKALPSAESQSAPTIALTNDANVAPPTDVDKELALSLQPLLEQEALLETFVEEALAQRKFEDVKTLKGNLTEIRAEIERMTRV